MAGRLRRFLHIERARVPGAAPAGRAGGDGAAEGAARSGRFDAVEERAAHATPQLATGAQLERFAPGSRQEPALELASRAGDARPFTRCARCEMDHGLHALVCAHCGERLDTPGVEAYNARLWADRQAATARDAAAGEALRTEQERAREDDARARRALAESLAREVGDRERRRLGVAAGGPETALGAVLLRALPDRRWKVAAACAAGAAVLGLLGGGLAARSPTVALAGLVLGIALAVPTGRRRRGG